MSRSYANFVCGVLLSAALTACVSEPSVHSPGKTSIDQELSALVADPVLGMSSLSVLAVRDGQVSYRGAFGQRYIHPTDPALNQPATPDTLYRIASISKFVTTMGALRLVEQGKLTLDRDVSEYLGYPLRNPAFPDQPLTLRMLLSHTSSLRDEAGYSWGVDTSLRQGMAAKPGAWDGRRPPGAYFAYSNLNWGVVGTIMEAVTGERFDLLMRRLVLDPLDIMGGYNVVALAPDELGQLATLYRKRPAEAGAWQPGGPWFAQVDDYRQRPPTSAPGLERYVPGTNATLFSPTGGLRVSAADLGKIMLMVLDNGRHKGSQFLSPASVKEMFANQWRFNPAVPNGDTHHGLFTAWGLGTQHFDKLLPGEPYPSSGHLGDAYGLMSVFALNFTERSGMVVLIGGTVSNPESTTGSYSAMSRQEEQVLTALRRHMQQRQ